MSGANPLTHVPISDSIGVMDNQMDSGKVDVMTKRPAVTPDDGQFNPRDYVEKIETKYGPADYLPVQWRIRWFRVEHPTLPLQTELIKESPYTNVHGRVGNKAIVRAWLSFEDGSIWSTAHAHASDFETPSYIQLAETRAIGRVLATAGYGIQFAYTDYEDDGYEAIDESLQRREKPASNGKTGHHSASNGTNGTRSPSEKVNGQVKNGSGEVRLAKPSEIQSKPSTAQDIAKLRAMAVSAGGDDNGIIRLAESLLRLQVTSVDDLPQAATANLMKRLANGLTTPQRIIFAGELEEAHSE